MRYNKHEIIEKLDAARQRATYGALAGVVDGSARSVMSGEEKNPRNSWIVSKRKHQPTGYTTREKHRDLAKNSLVLETPEALERWLQVA